MGCDVANSEGGSDLKRDPQFLEKRWVKCGYFEREDGVEIVAPNFDSAAMAAQT